MEHRRESAARSDQLQSASTDQLVDIRDHDYIALAKEYTPPRQCLVDEISVRTLTLEIRIMAHSLEVILLHNSVHNLVPKGCEARVTLDAAEIQWLTNVRK